MSPLAATTQDSFQLFADGRIFQIEKVRGNGVNHTSRPKELISDSPQVEAASDEAVSDEAVIKELECILKSQDFKDKPMLRGFLSFVVEETLAGRAHEIKGYTVATQVFGRRNDFDPTIDPIVRIQAGRLRRTLESYYLARGRLDQVRIEIGKGSYIPTFSMQIPEDPRLAQPKQPDETHHSEEMIFQAAAEAIPFSTGTGATIAVMPLVNLTNDPDQGCVADGLAEELMIELARCPALRVNASHSAAQWKGKQIGARDIGRRLGVSFFVEGSLRKEGRNIKVNLRLIDTSTGMQIWGEQYKRDLEPNRTIELQEDIARSAAGRIGGLFGVISRKLSKEARTEAPEDLDTREAFLRFSKYLMKLSSQEQVQALESLEYARAGNPESGLALSMLACIYANEYVFFCPEKKEMIEKAISLGRKGVLLEPHNQLARTLLAYIWFVSGRKELFLKETEQLLLVQPNSPDVASFLGWAMALNGEWERGLDLLETGVKNPFHPGWFHLASYLNYYRQDQFEEAFYEAERFNSPQLFWDPLLRAAALGQLEEERRARLALEELLATRADFPIRGPHLVGCLVKEPHLVQKLLEGLRKAGLDRLFI